MYIIAEYLNRTKLLDKFAGWARKAYSSGSDEYKRLMDQFLYDFYNLSKSTEKIKNYYHNIIEDFNLNSDRLKLNNKKILTWHPKMIDMLHNFQNYILNLCKLQDNLIFLMKPEAEIRIRTAHSLSKAIEKLDAYGFEPEIIRKITNYWETVGSKVEFYKNVENFAIEIFENVHVKNDQTYEFFIPLPDFTVDELSSHNLTFENETSILDFLVVSFNTFRTLIEDLSEEFGYETKLDFEKFFAKKINVDNIDTENNELRSIAVYFYENSILQGVEIYFDGRNKLSFNPIKNNGS